MDGKGTRHAGPGRAFERAVVGHQAHIGVRVRKDGVVGIVPGHALHGNGLRNTQLGAGRKAVGGHELATRVARHVGEQALHIADALLGEKGFQFGALCLFHANILGRIDRQPSLSLHKQL